MDVVLDACDPGTRHWLSEDRDCTGEQIPSHSRLYSETASQNEQTKQVSKQANKTKVHEVGEENKDVGSSESKQQIKLIVVLVEDFTGKA